MSIIEETPAWQLLDNFDALYCNKFEFGITQVLIINAYKCRYDHQLQSYVYVEHHVYGLVLPIIQLSIEHKLYVVCARIPVLKARRRLQQEISPMNDVISETFKRMTDSMNLTFRRISDMLDDTFDLCDCDLEYPTLEELDTAVSSTSNS